MNKIKIPKSEFELRIQNIRGMMAERGIDAVLIYGDEYRKENLRYVSNVWTILERGALLLGMEGDPIVLCAPEGVKVAEEVSAWPDIRLLPEFACVTVPDVIDYPLAQYTSLKSLYEEMNTRHPVRKMGIAGFDAMSYDLGCTLRNAFPCELVNINDILFKLRLTKSEHEAACLREAGRIAECGVRAVMNADIIGMSEHQAASIGEAACRAAGAEAMIFTLFSSGERTETIVGRSSGKMIEDGDMIQCAFAVQYEGYVSTCQVPFAVGTASPDTERVLDVLFHAYDRGIRQLKAGNPMKNMVCAVRDYFAEQNLSEYDVYPPLHGIGCAEAESPYPDSNTETLFEAGMCANTDISLFGLPGGSNRVEAGFIVTKDGAECLTPYVTECCDRWLSGRNR